MILNRKETLIALETVKPALAARSSIPELGHIWFDGEFVYAHNNGLGIKTKLESPLDCGVPGSLFLGLLNQAGTENLEFEAADDVLSFKVGRSKVKLNTMPIWQKIWRYPDTPSGKPTCQVKVSKAFLAALKYVLLLKSSSPSRMEHYAVCIYAVDKEMDLYTTDSTSMIIAPAAEPLTGVKKLAMPRELAEQLIAQCVPGQTLKVYSDHFAIEANSKAGIWLYSNVFDTAEMLDLPGTAGKFLSKDIVSFKLPEGFNSALKRAVLLSGTDDAMVTFKASGKALKLSGKYKSGQLDEDFTLNKSTPKAVISADAKVLLAVKGVVELAMSDKVIILFSNEESFTYILAGKEDATTKVARDKANTPEEEDA